MSERSSASRASRSVRARWRRRAIDQWRASASRAPKASRQAPVTRSSHACTRARRSHPAARSTPADQRAEPQRVDEREDRHQGQRAREGRLAGGQELGQEGHEEDSRLGVEHVTEPTLAHRLAVRQGLRSLLRREGRRRAGAIGGAAQRAHAEEGEVDGAHELDDGEGRGRGRQQRREPDDRRRRVDRDAGQPAEHRRQARAAAVDDRVAHDQRHVGPGMAISASEARAKASIVAAVFSRACARARRPPGEPGCGWPP